MMWVASSAAGTGTGELVHCEKSINALEYRRILIKYTTQKVKGENM